MASTIGSKIEEYKTPSPISIKKGLKGFLKLNLEIKENGRSWFDRFGDKSLAEHLYKKWSVCNKCAILFYNRLDPGNRFKMVKDTMTFKDAEAASVTSLGITSYMNYYSFEEIYGKEKSKELWKYLDFSGLCGYSKIDGGICAILQKSSDEEIDKVVEFVDKSVKEFTKRLKS